MSNLPPGVRPRDVEGPEHFCEGCGKPCSPDKDICPRCEHEDDDED